MLEVTTVEMNPDSREEYLPGYTPQFPHIASHVVAARYESSTTPWHGAFLSAPRGHPLPHSA